MSIFCSTIIPTVNRPTLSRAVGSVSTNTHWGEFEVVVVNDSGLPLPDMDFRQHSNQVAVVDTNRLERSVARNTGAAIARGKYLHFDDDDVLLPGALAHFWDLDQEGTFAWLCGSYETVDNCGHLIEEIHPEIEGNCFALLTTGEGIPLQASLVRADQFFAAGEFDDSLVGVEDRDLGRRLALVNEIAYTSALVARIRIGQEGSTTNWGSIAGEDRRGREKAPCIRVHFGACWIPSICALQKGKLYPSYWRAAASAGPSVIASAI